MLIWEWDEAGHGAPEDSLTRKLMPLIQTWIVEDIILRMECDEVRVCQDVE